MPILSLNPSPEPLATGYLNLDPSQRSILAESQAYDLLFRELDRYAYGEIAGKSFLVAGHRGSGKTTLVHKAIQDKLLQLQDAGAPVYLLLVPLYGPSLTIDVQRKEDVSNERSDANNPTLQTPQVNENAERLTEIKRTQEVLTQITIGLYRALAHDISQAYWKRMIKSDKSERENRLEYLELAAQLQLELDDVIQPAQLREMWDRAGALKQGVLFDKAEKSASLPDQGLRELVALSSAAQAFRVVAGETQQTAIQKSGVERTQEGSVSASGSKQDGDSGVESDTMKEFLNALLGLLAAGIVGLGALSVETNGLVAALVAVLTGLATVFGLNYSSSWRRSRTESIEVVFIRDNSISTLSRELPVLVRRLRQARIAPVFVVDELDKLENYDRIGELVGYLKHFIAERAFFCFLTDRNYYEHLEEKSRRESYPEEHTYFTHRLFVLYRPRDLRMFLRKLIDVDYVDNLDSEMLYYVLLHRSRQHPFDLRKELSKLTKAFGVEISEGFTSDQGIRFHIMIQLAIEWLLGQDALSKRLDQDPNFGQLAYDALYYPSRSWENSEEVLDVSEDAFETYLLQRVDKKSDSEPSKHDSEPPMSKSDLQFLYSQVCELLELITDTATMIDKLRGDPPQSFDIPESGLSPMDTEDLWSGILDSVPRYHSSPPAKPPDLRILVTEADHADVNKDKYRWRFDVFGRPLFPVEVANAAIYRDLFNDLNNFVNKLTNKRIGLQGLSTDVGMLPRTPIWEDVMMAQNRVDNFHKTGDKYDDLEKDQILVNQYATIILEYGPVLGYSLALSAAAGMEAGIDPPDHIINGLESLAQALNFRSATDVSEIEKALMSPEFGLDNETRQKLDLQRIGLDLEEWKANVNDLIDQKASEIAST